MGRSRRPLVLAALIALGGAPACRPTPEQPTTPRVPPPEPIVEQPAPGSSQK